MSENERTHTSLCGLFNKKSNSQLIVSLISFIFAVMITTIKHQKNKEERKNQQAKREIKIAKRNIYKSFNKKSENKIRKNTMRFKVYYY
jgi:hypothetical protein